MKKSTEYKMNHKSDFGKEKIQLLYEDSALCVIYKPEGILSVPYPGSHSKTAQDALEEILRRKGTFNKNHKQFVVHRLDRDTSGVMMFAMTEQAQKKIMDSWQKMVTERLYYAVAENPENTSDYLPDSGLIDDELAYNAHNIGFVPKKNDKPVDTESVRKSVSSKNHASSAEKSIYERNLEVVDGKLEFKTITARTNYRVLQRGKDFTLFELSLDTGRKNQIRAHLASKGYPLCGDENYRAKTDPFGRLALHARTLAFVHPFTGEKMKFEIPEPENWISVVENGRKENCKAMWNDFFQKSSGKRKVSEEKSFEKRAEKEVQLSRKKTRGMDFISQGKLKGRR